MLISPEIQARFDAYCVDRHRTPVMLIGAGVDGAVWRVDSDIVVKAIVHFTDVHLGNIRVRP